MDRLFARRVTVFGPVSLGDSTEAVLNTVLKARVQGLVCSEALCVCDTACVCDCARVGRARLLVASFQRPHCSFA
jgi:hypothetical protein